VSNVLQDDGFVVKNADRELGFISATKEIDLGGGPGWIWGVGDRKEPARWRKLKVIDATVNVSEYGEGVRVRASFQEKVLDNMGGVMEAGTIDDEAAYRDFFLKVDKGIFLKREKL